jgi:hypothetical protein
VNIYIKKKRKEKKKKWEIGEHMKFSPSNKRHCGFWKSVFKKNPQGPLASAPPLP